MPADPTVSDEDIDMAAAYLAPIVWSGVEWHQCTSSMKDAVRDHVRGLRGVGHARPIDWDRVLAELTSDECIDAAAAPLLDCKANIRDAMVQAIAAAKAKGAL